jgi:hypothetical protein
VNTRWTADIVPPVRVNLAPRRDWIIGPSDFILWANFRHFVKNILEKKKNSVTNSLLKTNHHKMKNSYFKNRQECQNFQQYKKRCLKFSTFIF